MKLVSVEEMRRIEQLTDERGQSYAAMMEQAGSWVAQIARSFAGPQIASKVLVLVGPGNNGGDGLVAAHYLREADCDVTLYIWKRDPKGDRNLSRLKRRKRGVTVLWADNDPDFGNLRQEVRRTGLIVDALLGTGVARPIAGRLAELLAVVKEELAAIRQAPAAPGPFSGDSPRAPLIEALVEPTAPGNPPLPDLASYVPGFPADARAPQPQSGPSAVTWFVDDLDPLDVFDDEDMTAEDEALAALMRAWPLVPVLAVDCPNRAELRHGRARSRGSARCHHRHLCFSQVGPASVSWCSRMRGAPGRKHRRAGRAGVDLPVELVERRQVQDALPARPRDANKGTFGKAMIAGGSLLYTGAPALSASAAVRPGAGLVTLAVPREVHAILAGGCWRSPGSRCRATTAPTRPRARPGCWGG